VWYMVYRVHYPGLDVLPVADPESNIRKSIPNSGARESVRFLPRFSIVSKERNLMIDAQDLAHGESSNRSQGTGWATSAGFHSRSERSTFRIFGRRKQRVYGELATWTDVDPRLGLFRGRCSRLDQRISESRPMRASIQSSTKERHSAFSIGEPGMPSTKLGIESGLGIPASESPERVQHYLGQIQSPRTP
jgi:hypothetical protein